MALDILSIGLGFGVGVIATIFVRELAFRNVQNKEHSKLTAHWSLTERGQAPVRLCVESLKEVLVPPNSQVLVARGERVPPQVAASCDVRVTDRVQSNFALEEGRALVFASSAVQPGTLAVWTYERQVLDRLSLEWDHAWRTSEPVTRRASVNSLKDLTGQTVEIVASVSDVGEKGGMHFLRLMENGFTATVASATPFDAGKGATVRALGTVEQPTGAREPVLRALKVELVRPAMAAR